MLRLKLILKLTKKEALPLTYIHTLSLSLSLSLSLCLCLCLSDCVRECCGVFVRGGSQCESQPAMACVYIPVQNSSEEVRVDLDLLPRDAADILDILKAEQAPLNLWLVFAVSFPPSLCSAMERNYHCKPETFCLPSPGLKGRLG